LQGLSGDEDSCSNEEEDSDDDDTIVLVEELESVNVAAAGGSADQRLESQIGEMPWYTVVFDAQICLAQFLVDLLILI